MDTKAKVHAAEGPEPRSLAKQFRPLARVLTICGPYRMKLEDFTELPTATESATVANWTWRNLPSLYPYMLLFWYILASLIWAFNVELDLPFPFHLAQFVHAPNGNDTSPTGYGFSTNRISNIFTAFLRTVENLTIFWTSSGLVTWLNGLTHLEREFNSYFGRINVHLDLDISKCIKRLLVGYFFIPSILWQLSFHAALLPNITFSPSLCILGNAWFFTYMYILDCEPLLEDVKVFAMLHCLRKIYNRFREAVSQDVVVRNGGINEKNFAFWLKYATKLRRQTEQTGEYLKTQIMLSSIETILGSSVGIYLVLRFSQSDTLEQSLGFVLLYVFYCIQCVVRLYVTALLAEGIYIEERQLYEDLIDMEQGLGDLLSHRVMDKLRNLRTYLWENPAQLNLGNYLVLNKGFLIQVGIQSVTMLIAVAQFHTA